MTEVSQNTPLNTSGEKLSIIDKYFSFRKEQRINFWMFFTRSALLLFVTVLGSQVCMIPAFLDRWAQSFTGLMLSIILIGALSIIVTYSWFIQVCKRVHDFDWQGRKYIAIILPLLLICVKFYVSWIVIIIVVVIMLVLKRPGNPGVNLYGPAPTGKPLV